LLFSTILHDILLYRKCYEYNGLSIRYVNSEREELFDHLHIQDLLLSTGNNKDNF